MSLLTRLSLAASLSLLPLGLWAEEVPSASAPHTREAAPATHGAKSEPAKPGEAHAAPTGSGAGDHGTAEGAHHGPAMKLFGKEYGKGGAFLVQLLNFIIYGAGLFFLLKGALSAMFKSRKEELVTLLAQAEKDRAEGEAQMKEMEAKMAGLEGELASILTKAEADAETEKQHVLEAAKAEAAQILTQAQAEIGHQKRQAEQELRALVAELAVEGAAKRLEATLKGPGAAKVAGLAMDRAIQKIGGAS